MTKRREGPLSADEVRCPACGAVTWHRVGERVAAGPPDNGRTQLRHVLVEEKGPWNWTCEQCGYAVRPTSRLDNDLSKVQPRAAPAIAGVGLGGAAGTSASAGGPLRNAPAQAAALAAGAVAVVIAVVIAGNVLGRPGASPPATDGAPASVGSERATVTDVCDITTARDGALAGSPVDLDDVPVESVTGDVTFWIGCSDQTAYVVLDEEEQPETAVTVRAGQRLRIVGTIDETPVSATQVPDGDRALLDGEALYVRAETVEIIED